MTSPLQQKIKITGPIVVTANRVTDGAVVYRRADGAWTTDLDAAVVAINTADAKILIAAASGDGLHTIDVYAAPVKLLPGGAVRPGNLRERIRHRGPTIELPVNAALQPRLEKLDAYVRL